MENSQFRDTVRSSLDEPIPYFSQFRSPELEESAVPQDGKQRSMVFSGVSASPDLYPEKDGERKERRQETSPNNDLLESWKIFHYEQLREQKEIMRR